MKLIKKKVNIELLNFYQLEAAKKGGNFEKENVLIEKLANGWYKCKLSGHINVSEIKIILGSTNEKNKILSWKAKTDEKSSVNIVPNSVTIKQIN